MHSAVSDVAQYTIYLIGLAAVVVWARLPAPQRVRLLLQAVLAAVTTVVLIKTAAWTYNDPRPFVTGHVRPYFPHPADNGFPSDHTAAAAMTALLLWPYRRLAGGLLLAAALLMGSARVVARVHHPLDIAAALLIAAAGAAAGSYAGGWLYRRRHPHPANPDATPRED